MSFVGSCVDSAARRHSHSSSPQISSQRVPIVDPFTSVSFIEAPLLKAWAAFLLTWNLSLCTLGSRHYSWTWLSPALRGRLEWATWINSAGRISGTRELISCGIWSPSESIPRKFRPLILSIFSVSASLLYSSPNKELPESPSPCCWVLTWFVLYGLVLVPVRISGFVLVN